MSGMCKITCAMEKVSEDMVGSVPCWDGGGEEAKGRCRREF